MRKRWIAGTVIIATPLVLAANFSGAFDHSQMVELSGASQVMSKFAMPVNVTVSSVMPTWATVRFVLPAADAAAASEEVVVYTVVNGSAAVASSATVSGSAATVTGLRPSTSYIAAVAVNADQGHAASSWTTSPEFVTPAASTSAPAASSAASPAATTPYAPALSAYNVLAQSYSATDIINDGWAQDANTTAEGAVNCPVANTSYSSALNAVVMTTQGTPSTSGSSSDCAHIRSQFTVPTSGDVVEAEIWLPSLASARTFGGTSYPAGALLDWASMWTDGADSTNGPENWPADTELDAVESQYGASYISVHYGRAASGGGSTGNWTTAPVGWGPAGTTFAPPNAGAANVRPGWNVVDIEFTPADANIYFNGQLFVTVPGSVLTHDPAYLDFGISGPEGSESAYRSWPAGPAAEAVAYVKVFS